MKILLEEITDKMITVEFKGFLQIAQSKIFFKGDVPTLFIGLKVKGFDPV